MKIKHSNHQLFVVIVCSAFAILFSFSSYAQIITTIAGNGTSVSVDGGPATNTGIGIPTHTAVDNLGNLYFGDYGNNRIRKINTAGIVSTVAGNGSIIYLSDGIAATATGFNGTAGIAIDAVGNIYFADYHGDRVCKVNTSGIISTITGNGTLGFSGDNGPATAAMINIPWGVAVDNAGNIYFADRDNNRIRKINNLGVISTIAGSSIIGSYSGDGGPATAATLNGPCDIALDRAGNLLFSDIGNNRIRKIDNSGIITTVAGNGIAGYSGDNVAATTTELNAPIGVGIDTFGNIYIGDGNNRVRKVNPLGIISTIAGTGSASYGGDGGMATAAQLNTPYGVAVYGAGIIYVCDGYNNRIRVIKDGNANHPPSFLGGSTQNLIVCSPESPTNIDSLLAIIDSDAGQTETWTLTMAPAHGTANVAYTAISTGGAIIPTGLNYSPDAGYTGTDMFQVTVTDGFATATVTIDVSVGLPPNAGIISGVDSVCPGYTAALSETVPGGIWSSSNFAISDITSHGLVTGLLPGVDTIIYTVINDCGVSSAIFPFIVGSYSNCGTGVPIVGSAQHESLQIFPNPSTGTINVKLNSNTETHAVGTIYNILGEKEREFNFPTNQPFEVNLDLSSGVYFIRVLRGGSSFEQKIIITD